MDAAAALRADIDDNWRQLREADEFLAEIARQQRQDAELLRKFRADAEPPGMDADAAAQNLCVFDIPDPSVRAAIATDSDDPALVYVPPETSANTDPYASQPRATGTDADIAEIDAAVEREVAAGFDIAETRVCEM